MAFPPRVVRRPHPRRQRLTHDASGSFTLLGRRTSAHVASLHFLGAAGTVTGSKITVNLDGHTVLVDCGLFQG